MALDGVMLGLIGKEIKERALGARVDKIHQPSREELVFVLRTREGTLRLLVSAGANHPRVHFTESFIENPAQPPMLCMLFRKKLGSARLCDVRQYGSDRVLMLDFEAVDELGDRQILTLYVEIMGRCSNAILTSQDGRVIDSVKRVDLSMSSVRPVIPGVEYMLPPQQDKIDLRSGGDEIGSDGIGSDEIGDDMIDAAMSKVLSAGEIRLDKAILSAVMGISPIVSREIAYCVSGGCDSFVSELGGSERDALRGQLTQLRAVMADGGATPVMVSDKSGKPVDITFFVPNQYGTGADIKSFESFSALLDNLYSVKDQYERMRVKEKGLIQTLTSSCERIAKKLAIQKIELERAENREGLRKLGDLITANIYRLKKGDTVCDLTDYETGEDVTVTLDPRLTPPQNAQKYYKEYAKMKTAEQHLVKLIAAGEKELAYLNSTLDVLSRAATVRELAEIREELEEGGYIRKQNSKAKKPAALPPIKYISDDGFTILVGRNNKQNDRLTLKDSMKRDIWLHVSKQPGSHVIIVSDGREIPSSTIEQAAIIAAYHSSARDAGLTAVDFTLVRHVSKPQGSKPGMVIYTDQTTVFVRPAPELAKRLAAGDK